MKYLIRVAFAALSLASIVPVANAATNFRNGSTVSGDSAATQMQQYGAQ